jgi:hypothetical protein
MCLIATLRDGNQSLTLCHRVEPPDVLRYWQNAGYGNNFGKMTGCLGMAIPIARKIELVFIPLSQSMPRAQRDRTKMYPSLLVIQK